MTSQVNITNLGAANNSYSLDPSSTPTLLNKNNQLAKSSTSILEAEDISSKVISTFENANTVRLRYITDFISQLEKDYTKYGNKKRKFVTIKTILFVFDLAFASAAFISSVVVESIGAQNHIITIISSGVGLFCLSFLPIITKFTEVFSNKNRNFENLAVNKLNRCKIIFSKSIEDNKISHEELLDVMDVKNQYESAKEVLKKDNKKEVDDLLKKGGIASKDDSNLSKDAIIKQVEEIIKQAKNGNATGAIPTGFSSYYDTPGNSIYPPLNSVSPV